MTNSARAGRPWNARQIAAIVSLGFLLGIAPRAAQGCVGDCNGDGEVTIEEITTMVDVALGGTPLSLCPIGDQDASGAIEINEVITAVNNALSLGCEGPHGCGNAVVERYFGTLSDEDCDDGGLCIGGPNAGTLCTSDVDCHGNGICAGGPKTLYSCASDTDCPGGRCAKCKPFGGDGCAANCTLEKDIPFNLVPGRAVGLDLQAGTSGAVVHGDILTIPLPLSGSQTLTAGKDRGDGLIPLVIKAASVHFPIIPVSTLACACVRGVPLETCGGTLFEANGTPSPSCTETFQDAVDCPAEKPCAFVHGPGNSATGVLACGNAGLSEFEVTTTQNAGACGNPPDCDQRVPEPPQLTLGGLGPPGSAIIFNSTAIGTVVGPCPADFCSDADPLDQRGAPQTIPLTTGTACCEITNANFQDGVTIGPFCAHGEPVHCGALNGQPIGGGVAGAFPTLNQLSVGDICVTSQFFAQ